MHSIVVYRDLSSAGEALERAVREAVVELSVIYGLHSTYSIVVAPVIDEKLNSLKIDDSYTIEVGGKNVSSRELVDAILEELSRGILPPTNMSGAASAGVA